MADAGGPMKTKPGLGAGLGELFVLAQEAVAGVDGLCAGGLGGFNDFFPAQVAVLGRAATNVNGFVAGGDVLGVGIGIGVHRHGLDGQAAGGGGDAAGDFATVGNQNFGKHGASLQKRAW